MCWLLFLLVFLFSCRPTAKKENAFSSVRSLADTTWYFGKTDTLLAMKNDWAATLDIHARRDSMEFFGVSGQPAIKMITIKGFKVAVVIDNDSLYLFRRDDEKFRITGPAEKINGMDWTFQTMDLNWDGYTDIWASEVEGAHANRFTTTLLYDPTNNSLKHRTDMDFVNPVYYSEKHVVKTESYSSLCGTAEKRLYQITPDTLELLKSVTLSAHCEMDDDKRKEEIHLIRRIEGKLVEDSFYLAPKMAWSMYKNAF
jgi:hypothetical protein